MKATTALQPGTSEPGVQVVMLDARTARWWEAMAGAQVSRLPHPWGGGVPRSTQPDP